MLTLSTASAVWPLLLLLQSGPPAPLAGVRLAPTGASRVNLPPPPLQLAPPTSGPLLPGSGELRVRDPRRGDREPRHRHPHRGGSTLARASTYLPEPPDTYTVDGASIGFGNEMLAEPLTEADATDGALPPM
jgi:hypothetical protein